MVEATSVKEDHLGELIGHLIAVKPSLRAEDIRAGSSITEDLGFDSMDLVRLATRIRDTCPDFDLRAWLVGAVQSEGDSVGSMAVLLARTMAAAEGSNV